MPILVTGVRHKMASIDVREQFALLENDLEASLQHLINEPSINECAILTTCNRSEIYLHVDNTAQGIQAVHRYYETQRQIDVKQHRQHLFTLVDEDAVLYLFRVASGLDSLILGEGQILGQVKDTLQTARTAQTIGIHLDKLFKMALTVGKRVRTETGIAQKDVSVSRSAFELARTLRPDLLNQKIALIGGGKMASIVMASLDHMMTEEQKQNVAIVNRSEKRLLDLTERYGFEGYTWQNLDTVIQDADVLFVATGAPHVILGPAHFTDLSSTKPKLVLDISVPRNVAPSVGELDCVELYNTDNLEGINSLSDDVQTSLKAHAQRIIDSEYRQFVRWCHSRQAAPVITQLHTKFEEIRQAELSKRKHTDSEQISLLDELSRTLVKKILHDPTVQLRSSDNMNDIYRQAGTLARLFRIDIEEANHDAIEYMNVDQ